MLDDDLIISMIRTPEEFFPQRSRYYGVYYGTVEDNRDPKNLGRLKIRTPVYSDVENLPTDNLPWAPFVGPSGGSKNAGFYFVPPIGSQVAVEFIDGHPTYPVWLGTVWGAPGGDSDTYVSTINPGNPYGLHPAGDAGGWSPTKYHSLTTPYGHRLELDDNVHTASGATTKYTRIQLSTPDGFYLRIVEDVTQQAKPSDFRGSIELGTKDSRRCLLDDNAETIRIDTPDGHRMELSSVSDFVRIETEDGHYLVFDDPSRTVELSTAGDDVVEKGYRLLLDEGNRRALLKGDEEEYFFEMREGSLGSHLGMYSRYPSGNLAGVEVRDFYRIAGGVQRDSVNVYAGSRNTNGVFADCGDGQRSRAVYLYDTSQSTPKNIIKLVTTGASGENDGFIRIGENTTSPLSNKIEVDPSLGVVALFGGFTGIRLTASSIGIGPASGSGGSSVLTINGPWLSTYFSHKHMWDIIDGPGKLFAGAIPVTQTGVITTRGVDTGT